MNDKQLRELVLRVVLTELARVGETYVPVTSSGRHVHLSQPDLNSLFGEGYRLTKLRDLLQPGQYACNETVVLKGPKGSLRLRIVGPTRKETQVELSQTDCFQLGIPPILRMSGDTAGTPGGVLANGEKSLSIPSGILVAARHLHMSPHEAAAYQLKDGDLITLQSEGQRAAALENLVVRCGESHRMEAHIDRDEANACGITDGQLVRLSLSKKQVNVHAAASIQAYTKSSLSPQSLTPSHPSPHQSAAPVARLTTKLLDLVGPPRPYVGEEEMRAAVENGYQIIRYQKGSVITPLARDIALAKGIELLELS